MMKSAQELLLALRRLVPDATPSITLADDDQRLVVGLCYREAPIEKRFYSYVLDEVDLIVPIEPLAADLVAMHAELYAKRNFAPMPG